MAQFFPKYQKHVMNLVESALKAADPALAVRRHLTRKEATLSVRSFSYDMERGRVFLVGAGKASISMASEAAEILGNYLAAGIVISKGGDQELASVSQAERQLPDAVQVFRAGHPVPDERGVKATAAITPLLEETNANDLVLCLISGGASALMTQPILPLDQWQQLVNALLASGCTINELNTVRKQLDRVKGGGLAKLAAPAPCVSLILSDVVGNPLHLIGSGPTVFDPDHPTSARDILRRYNVASRLDNASWQMVDQQLPLQEQGAFIPESEVHNVIVGDIRTAAEAAANAARALGFSSRVLSAHVEGEAREVGRVIAALAKGAEHRSCLVLGGETTVTVRGDGLGGRNLELALAAAITLDGWDQVVVASFATDGEDGLTNAAGAVVTGLTASAARAEGIEPLDFLDRNDSYHFFSQVGGLIETGPTGTNVNDLILILRY